MCAAILYATIGVGGRSIGLQLALDVAAGIISYMQPSPYFSILLQQSFTIYGEHEDVDTDTLDSHELEGIYSQDWNTTPPSRRLEDTRVRPR